MSSGRLMTSSSSSAASTPSTRGGAGGPSGEGAASAGAASGPSSSLPYSSGMLMTSSSSSAASTPSTRGGAGGPSGGAASGPSSSLPYSSSSGGSPAQKPSGCNQTSAEPSTKHAGGSQKNVGQHSGAGGGGGAFKPDLPRASIAFRNASRLSSSVPSLPPSKCNASRPSKGVPLKSGSWTGRALSSPSTSSMPYAFAKSMVSNLA
mmetsp:Transcript_104827/g.338003  ORF Transcript_104827/g.338003 Transcript_104827/m.338003 type:complete len:206 (-) Transcript_104827:617-1234(-)